jgi:EAL domain-containing protein (putative c-di-GMP-specific phosphodiesterase class I)/GGDEF domain-containing protein
MANRHTAKGGHVWTLLVNEGSKELSNLPLLLLQYTAILGILGLVLIAYRAFNVPVTRSQIVYGVVLGVTGYLLTLLVAEFIQSPSKPYVRNDLLFLGFLLGGWRGGGIAFALMLLARWQFGGNANMLAATLDMLMMCAGGMVAHLLVGRQPLLDLRWPQLLWVWLLRVAVSLLAVGVIALLDLVPSSINHSAVARRLIVALPALALLAGMFTIFRLDAQHHALQQRERERGLLHPLTGLRNRRAMLDHLQRLFAQTPPQPHTLVLLESANYVEMLLAQGHSWTDSVWRDVAAHIESTALPQTLSVCRPQVFQFTDTALAVVLHGLSSQEVEHKDLAQALHHSLHLIWREATDQAHLPQIRLTVTHLNHAEHPTAAEAMRDASLLLQQRIDLGEPVHFFHRGFAQQAALDSAVLSQVLQWIDTGRPPMGYQPKCHLSTLRVEGAEALLRPPPIDAHTISPSHVLAVAARHHLLPALEWSTVLAVVRDARSCWKEAPGLSLSVNISGASLSAPGFAERVQALLHDAHLPPSVLTLELTESSPLPDVESVKANLRTLHACGIALSLDDFGSGYSGLSVLAHHPFAEVKIDQHMVAMIDVPRMKSAIQIALDTARHYDAKFVAEGVETQAQSDTLARMGVDTGQGYLFAAALPIHDFLAFVRRSLVPGHGVPLPA